MVDCGRKGKGTRESFWLRNCSKCLKREKSQLLKISIWPQSRVAIERRFGIVWDKSTSDSGTYIAINQKLPLKKALFEKKEKGVARTYICPTRDGSTSSSSLRRIDSKPGHSISYHQGGVAL